MPTRHRGTIPRRLGWGLLVLVAIVAAGPPTAYADDLDASLKRHRARLVRRLESALEWAKGKQISGFRHDIYERILEVEPDHRRARKVLKYARASKSAPWVRDASYTRPADWNRGMLDKARARLEKAFTEYRDAALEALEGVADPPSGVAEAVIEGLVDLMPEDASLRKYRGDVEHNGRWVLPETVDSDDRRSRFRALSDALRQRVRQAVRTDDKGVTAGWDVAIRTEKRTVLSTVREADAYETLVNMEVGDLLCAELFGPREDTLGPTEVLLLASRDEAKRVFARMKNAEALRNLDAVGAQILAKGVYVSYRKSPKFLRVGALRQVVDRWLDRTFPGPSRGWIAEGVGQRITWYVTGRHGPGFVSLSGTEREQGEDEGPDVLPDDPADWPKAAARVLRRDGPSRLVGLLTRRLNAMEAGDVLVAYGLAAYLLEARPDLFRPLAEASVGRTDADAYIPEVLGADAMTVAWRLRRWLLEVR